MLRLSDTCNWARGKRPPHDVMKIMRKQVGPFLIEILKYDFFLFFFPLFSSLSQPAVPDEEGRVGKVVWGN